MCDIRKLLVAPGDGQAEAGRPGPWRLLCGRGQQRCLGNHPRSPSPTSSPLRKKPARRLGRGRPRHPQWGHDFCCEAVSHRCLGCYLTRVLQGTRVTAYQESPIHWSTSFSLFSCLLSSPLQKLHIVGRIMIFLVFS